MTLFNFIHLVNKIRKVRVSGPVPCLLGLSMIFFVMVSCGRLTDAHWSAGVPETSVMVLVYDENSTPAQVLERESATFLQETSMPGLSDFEQIPAAVSERITVHALVVNPATANALAPVWLLQSDISASRLANYFSRPFTQNSYRFQGTRIYRLYLPNGKVWFLTALGSTLAVSPNSRALEESVKSFTGSIGSMTFPGGAAPSQATAVFLNYPNADAFAMQLGRPIFRPVIEGSFAGLTPAALRVETLGNQRRSFVLNSRIPLTTPRSGFTQVLAMPPVALRMDRYIPRDAAVFGMFQAERIGRLDPGFEFGDESELDELLEARPQLVSALSSTLGEQAAFAGFYTLGFSPLEETAWLRLVTDRSSLRSELDRLVADGHGSRSGNFYTFRSRALAQILGGALAPYESFSLGILDDVIVLAPRTGLIQRISTDINRRRVLFFDDEYLSRRRAHPERLSAFFFADNSNFRSFIEPYTDPGSVALSYLGYFDLFALSVRQERDELEVQTRLDQIQRQSVPFVDRWFFPVTQGELTGPATVGNLQPNSRNDIVFATTANRVVALAADGTEIFTASTNDDRPVGSPVLFDWYANNQTAVLIAAGNKIYGWNNRGQLLPNFPFELDEQITSPLLVHDISRSGLPEAVVATRDRRLHVLGGRGTNISGWPQTTNTAIEHQPVFADLNGRFALIAQAGNAVFAWNADGNLRDGFPVFADAPLYGSPVVHQNRIYTGGQNGRLYAVSRTDTFLPELSQSGEGSNGTEEGRYRVRSVEVSSGNVSAARIQNLRIPLASTGIDTEEQQSTSGSSQTEMAQLIALQSGSSVFLYDLQGRLRFTRSIGRPIDTRAPLIIEDLNRDGRPEIIVTAQFGRMYAWTIETGTTYQGLPATAVRFPTTARLGSDGLTNIIAGSGSGVSSWAIRN